MKSNILNDVYRFTHYTLMFLVVQGNNFYIVLSLSDNYQ